MTRSSRVRRLDLGGASTVAADQPATARGDDDGNLNPCERMAGLLLPYCCREVAKHGRIDHKSGWWFSGAPPDVVRDAFSLDPRPPGLRPDDQPPVAWLVEQASLRSGMLA